MTYPTYAPNAVDWPVDSLVLHDADAKVPRMLMRVIGRTRDGRYRSRYVSRDCPPAWRRRTWTNDRALLLDPARFGISVTQPYGVGEPHAAAGRAPAPAEAIYEIR